MKILHITDSHGTVKGPESRKDVYYITFLKKMYELSYVVKRYNIDMVIHTGDLFHTARVSDKFAGQVSGMIRAMGVPFYVVPGNHDIEGYTIDTIDQTKLGLLAKTGVITLLERDAPILITGTQNGEEYTVAISGQEYYAHIDEGNMSDFEMQQDEADLNILAIHGYLTSTPQHPDIKCTMCHDVITDADIILTGHYHRQFEWSDGQGVNIFNPGSMMRVEQTDYNKTHRPQYGILDIGLDDSGNIVWDYNFHEFRIAEDSTVVFDYDSKYKAKHTSITLEGFKNSLANTVSQVNVSSNNIQTIIQNICSGASIDPQIEKKAIDVYNLTLQSAPDEFEVRAGFIEGNHKKISHVVLKNFQSHEDTTLYFDKGLNIIVGESNNGKTAILRAIMWAIDNEPLGTDFIMAGKDECSVSVYFDDGTSIKRSRTRKDTGEYEIYYHDENGKLQCGQYKGFTFAVPVEVANVHQMPKVNITKDIETHLNVLSQLDPPFLITESPMVKASAIGRITGTHILDSGVKQSNKTIQSNKKTIKVHNDTLVEKNNELNKLQDPALLESFFKHHQAIVNYINSKYNRILKINEHYNKICLQDKIIDSTKASYEEKKAMAKLLPFANSAREKVERCLKINSLLDNYGCIDKRIYMTEEDIERCNMLMKVQVIGKQAGVHLFNVIQLSEGFKKVNFISDSILETSDKATSGKEFAHHIESIIAYCNILHGFISKVKPKLDLIDELSVKEQTLKAELSSHKKFIKTLKTSITKTTKEQNKYVLDNGICPCCGQPVTETTHSESIINFFSNNKED